MANKSILLVLTRETVWRSYLTMQYLYVERRHLYLLKEILRGHVRADVKVVLWRFVSFVRQHPRFISFSLTTTTRSARCTVNHVLFATPLGFTINDRWDV